MNVSPRPLDKESSLIAKVDYKAAGRTLLHSVAALESRRKILIFLALSIGLSFFASVFQAISPILFSQAIDIYSTDTTSAQGMTFIFISLATLVISKFLVEQRWLVYQPVENQILNYIRETYLKHLLALPVSYHLNRSIGRLDSIVGQGLGGIQTLSGMLFTQLCPLVFEIIITFVALMAFVDFQVSAVILTTIAIYILVLIIGAELVSRRLSTALVVSIEAQGAAADAILNTEGIKTLAIEEEIVNSYRDRLNEVHARFRRFYFSRGFLGLALSTVLLCGFALALWLSTSSVMYHTLSIGALVLTNTYVLQLFRTMEGFSFSYRDTRQSFEAVKRFLEVFGEPTDPDEHSLQPVDGIALLEVDKVSFRYPDGRTALNNATLRIETGKITALLGRSGSGKSTLVRLITKTLPLELGSIRVNGISINQLNGIELRHRISVVPQDAVMFRDNLAFNVTLTRNPDRLKLEAAIRAAEIEELVHRLPEGFHTEIGERGFKLSGGERQRLAIARAIYRDAEVLIFDEATSALDETTKGEILRLIQHLSPRYGILLITHDKLVASTADYVVSLDESIANGIVVASGLG